MKIFLNNTEILDIQVDDNSYRYRAIKGDHNLTLYFSLAEHVEIPIGAYCVYENETYTLEKPESLTMKHSRYFEYTVVFDSPQAKASKWKFMNPVDRRLKFPLTAKPIEHLQMFVDNMNQRDSGWTIGRCIDAPEKTISYNHAYCIDALSQMADEWETEYEFVGKQVSLLKVEYNRDNPLPLSYGKGNGFKPGIGRSNYEDSTPIEILYVQGGEQNIDASQYGSSELLLPKSQTIRFDGEHFEGEPEFNSSKARTYKTDADGFSIRRADKALSSQAEDSLDCSEIYPSRVGTISAVTVVDAGKHFYDIVDNSIPDSLNFEDCLIAGETLTIIPQTGMLAGKEFEAKYIHNATGGKAARRFEIVPQEIDGQTMPGSNYIPRVGDTYAVFHCMLPAAYICDNATKTGASWDMFRQSVKYLYDNEEQKFTFTGELDGIWAKKDWLNISGRIKLGGFVQFSDERFQPEGVSVRIIGIKDYINNPHSPEIELSNSTVGRSVSSDLRKIESNEVVMDTLHKEALQFTKRRYRDAKETIEMLEASMLDNFTNSVNPLAVQTMMMLVGDESLQFRFVNSAANPTPVVHNVVYDAARKVLSVPAGVIQHMTLGIASLSDSHSTGEYRFWTLPLFESAVLNDGSKRYYLYAKVSRTAKTGTFLLSETAIAMSSSTGYYHLLMGILNSEFNGERSYISLYGFTEILPGRLTTDSIVSSNGKLSIDLLHGIISGNIKLSSGSSGLENFSEWDNKQQQITEAGQTASKAKEDAATAKQAASDAADAAANADKNATSALGAAQNAEGTANKAKEDAATAKQTASDAANAAANADKNATSALGAAQNAEGKANEAKSTAEEALRNIQSAQDFIDNTLPEELSLLQSQIDGQIEAWFLSYDPTASNAPASAWTTASEKEKHLNDTFTNTETGRMWRWTKSNGNYSWVEVADTAVAKAVAMAGRAQDTADGKRRIFITAPVPPYDPGDLWAPGESGRIKRCVRGRQTGSFTASDWEDADNTTKFVDGAIKESIAAISSSARNLIRRSASITADGKDYVATLTATVDAGSELALAVENIEVIAGTSTGCRISLQNRLGADIAEPAVINTGGSATHVFRVKKNLSTAMAAFLVLSTGETGSGAGQHVRFDKVSLVKGNLPMAAWMEAPEDLQERIDFTRKAIDAMNDDTVFDVTEKHAIRSQWENISGVADTVSNVLAGYGGSFSYTMEAAQEVRLPSASTGQLRTAIGNLQSQLDVWELYEDTNTPDFNRQALAELFSAYYLAEKAVADAVTQKKLDDVQVGGVNILRNTLDFTTGWGGSGKVQTDKYRDFSVVYTDATSTTASYILARQQSGISLEPNTVYTLSFWAKGSVNNAKVLTYCYPSVNAEIIASNGGTEVGHTGSDTYYMTILSTSWKRYFVTFRTLSSVKPSDSKIVQWRVVVGSAAYICGAQLEVGTKMTAWSPALDDIQTQIDDLSYLKTVFPDNLLDSDGAVLSQLLGVKNGTAADASVVAGLYGGGVDALNAAGLSHSSYGTLMAFFGAKTAQQAASAKTRIWSSGRIDTDELYATGGTFSGFLRTQFVPIPGNTTLNSSTTSYVRYQVSDHFYLTSEGLDATKTNYLILPTSINYVGAEVVILFPRKASALTVQSSYMWHPAVRGTTATANVRMIAYAPLNPGIVRFVAVPYNTTTCLWVCCEDSLDFRTFTGNYMETIRTEINIVAYASIEARQSSAGSSMGIMLGGFSTVENPQVGYYKFKIPSNLFINSANSIVQVTPFYNSTAVSAQAVQWYAHFVDDSTLTIVFRGWGSTTSHPYVNQSFHLLVHKIYN